MENLSLLSSLIISIYKIKTSLNKQSISSRPAVQSLGQQQQQPTSTPSPLLQTQQLENLRSRNVLLQDIQAQLQIQIERFEVKNDVLQKENKALQTQLKLLRQQKVVQSEQKSDDEPVVDPEKKSVLLRQLTRFEAQIKALDEEITQKQMTLKNLENRNSVLQERHMKNNKELKEMESLLEDQKDNIKLMILEEKAERERINHLIQLREKLEINDLLSGDRGDVIYWRQRVQQSRAVHLRLENNIAAFKVELQAVKAQFTQEELELRQQIAQKRKKLQEMLDRDNDDEIDAMLVQRGTKVLTRYKKFAKILAKEFEEEFTKKSQEEEEEEFDEEYDEESDSEGSL